MGLFGQVGFRISGNFEDFFLGGGHRFQILVSKRWLENSNHFWSGCRCYGKSWGIRCCVTRHNGKINPQVYWSNWETAISVITRWCFQRFFVTPKIGEDEPIWTVRIFFNWVGKNHQLVKQLWFWKQGTVVFWAKKSNLVFQVRALKSLKGPLWSELFLSKIHQEVANERTAHQLGTLFVKSESLNRGDAFKSFVGNVYPNYWMKW